MNSIINFPHTVGVTSPNNSNYIILLWCSATINSVWILLLQHMYISLATLFSLLYTHIIHYTVITITHPDCHQWGRLACNHKAMFHHIPIVRLQYCQLMIMHMVLNQVWCERSGYSIDQPSLKSSKINRRDMSCMSFIRMINLAGWLGEIKIDTIAVDNNWPFYWSAWYST